MKLRKWEVQGGLVPDAASVVIEGRNPATGSKIRSTFAMYHMEEDVRAQRAIRSRLIRDIARCVLLAAAEETLWGHVNGSDVYESGGHEFFGGEPPVLPRFASEDLPAGIYQEDAP